MICELVMGIANLMFGLALIAFCKRALYMYRNRDYVGENSPQHNIKNVIFYFAALSIRIK